MNSKISSDIFHSTKKEISNLMNFFVKEGSHEITIPALLNSDILLDLYGEDLHARAYTVLDPVRGNLMLRPDFTVPVVQMHMSEGNKHLSKSYCYSGTVWRKQEQDSLRPSEYVQVGVEFFGGKNKVNDDAKL